MDSYEIIITPDAESDLIDLRDYITEELLAPETALRYVREIRNEIAKLEYIAPSIKVVDDEPFHTMGIRRLMVNNFIFPRTLAVMYAVSFLCAFTFPFFETVATDFFELLHLTFPVLHFSLSWILPPTVIFTFVLFRQFFAAKELSGKAAENISAISKTAITLFFISTQLPSLSYNSLKTSIVVPRLSPGSIRLTLG